MSYAQPYPVGFLLEGVDVALVGGDALTLEKVDRFLHAEARVMLFATEITDAGLRRLVTEGRIAHEPRRLEPQEATRFRVVVSLEADDGYSRALYAATRGTATLLNCHDLPQLSDFTHSSLVRSGLLQIAIFTAGASPIIGRKIRRGLEKAFNGRFAAFIGRMAELRERLKAAEPDAAKRKAALEEAAEGFELHAELEYPRDER